MWDLKFVSSGYDGAKLRVGVHAPNGISAVSRWIVLANGRAEWLEKYSHLLEDLPLPEDVGVVSWDHRGQGASEGVRAHIDSYDIYCADAVTILNEVVAGKPWVGLGHSTGALILLLGSMRKLFAPERLVLCSPLLGLPEHPLPSSVLKSLCETMVKFGWPQIYTGGVRHKNEPFPGNVLTSSFKHFDKLRKNDYVLPSPTTGWINATFTACEEVLQEDLLKDFEVPTLVIAGTEECVVNSDAFQRWVKRASKASRAEISFHWIPGARHELLAEVERHYQRVLNLISDWLRPVGIMTSPVYGYHDAPYASVVH